MTFYFKPPRGTITLQTLQSCIQERLKYVRHIEFLDDLSNIDDEHFDPQYLLDGSAFDRTGHYMLRLLSLKDENVLHFFMKYETILFEKRLKGLDAYHVRVELKTVLRHLNEILRTIQVLPKYVSFLQFFLKLCQNLSQRDLAEHAFRSDHSNNCENHSVKVPFTLCLSLVQHQEVEIKDGIATIPCGKWQPLLVGLFQIHLNFGLDQLKTSDVVEDLFLDNRVQYISEIYRNSFRSLTSRNNLDGSLTSEDVDCESSKFPPCMASLHRILRQRHRLTHNARFHYSLFLKDIGLPLEEAYEFWKKEYTQPHTGCTSCSHSWQKDWKRYLYSIRHLYGLEGARRSYKTPCCRQLQMLTLGSNSEGGCPFVHYDDNKLIWSFSDKIRTNSEAVQSLLHTNKTKGPKIACQEYFSLVCELNLKEIESKVETNISPILEGPVNFYLGQRHKNSIKYFEVRR